MYDLARSLLFKLDPEVSHELSLDLLGASGRLGLSGLFPKVPHSSPIDVMGLRFPNAVGLAAGLDKNADAFEALGALGFGFVEVGTVTPKGQSGNPKPRLFRLPEHDAVINRMGFNNKGVEHLVSRVKKHGYKGILGINIGKNLTTSVDDAASDYLKCLEEVIPYADYITANISSPNTPGLRSLQFGESLAELISPLVEAKKRYFEEYGKNVPLAVKIAPDMTDDEIKLVADTLVEQNVDGIIATNTTLSRDAVKGHRHEEEAGGLSGAPVREQSTHVVRILSDYLKDELPVIGVGGILSGKDAVEKLEAGAKLVQIYSGFIYKGPELVREAITSTDAYLREVSR
ncbi:quinone-dependent dihydroorotate dehydrogenase [Marinomonas mediterranea]|jgi:dihydroorotate oxidase A (EC 1.3.3.1)|uniref:Dihydroorotate dehydrogenase (quinone) n=1 Tax=Marinomonas mediterranea (strain ATCC 700492 / JCM 21426 / NBRC 103028 / MMB-1) TaxID=717774 RepID=F2JWN2_MARM1|nr:quinone-dependent dihydroorotate dehydrogenase [Marinomonas mediterranea]ADZ91796.1 Dihydroorotate dehydrogenase [Marinomonas mediterranea MMB-1]WCN13833.1 quinone-dependent dihydroorotate dehydrogenase [Marinomonas mediterranea]WCN17889.1 quinone-dependent dihydroorotate dehydrogenase [Marinomonas mediterranea MMB-1]